MVKKVEIEEKKANKYNKIVGNRNRKKLEQVGKYFLLRGLKPKVISQETGLSEFWLRAIRKEIRK